MAIVTLGNAIFQFIRCQGFEKRLKQADVFRLWKEIVGETIADKAKPERIENGVLSVSVENDAWRNELVYLMDDLKNKINNRVGMEIVKMINFK